MKPTLISFGPPMNFSDGIGTFVNNRADEPNQLRLLKTVGAKERHHKTPLEIAQITFSANGTKGVHTTLNGHKQVWKLEDARKIFPKKLHNYIINKDLIILNDFAWTEQYNPTMPITPKQGQVTPFKKIQERKIIEKWTKISKINNFSHMLCP